MNPLLLVQLIGPLLAAASRPQRAPVAAAADEETRPSGNQVDLTSLAAIIASLSRPADAPPPEIKLPRSAAVIATVVVLGFFAAQLALGWLLIIGREPNPALYVGFGALLVLTTVVVCFLFGSSWGSRSKDAQRSQEGLGNVIPFPVPNPLPPPPPLPPTPEPGPLPPVAVEPTTGIGRSTDPSTASLRSDVPPNGQPASIRYNNPGAQYPSARAAAFGQTGYGIIGGGHKIACFPHPVNGAAANFDLMYRNYTGMTIGAAGDKWTGGNGFGVPGYDPNTILSKESLDKPEIAIALMKAVARREAGRESPLTEMEWRQGYDMSRAGSADAWLDGVRTVQAKPTNLATAIVAAMRVKGYVLDTNPGEVNIVYVEGLNEDGTINDDAADQWNDLRVVIGFDGASPVVLGKWRATTEPGAYYTNNPINPSGAARIEFGQYTAWRVGMHRGDHEALVQRGVVTVARDLDKNMIRTGDARDVGDNFGINQHGPSGTDEAPDNVGKFSAGCLVGKTMAGHRAFMAIVKADPRFVADPEYLFRTAILAERDVVPA